MSYKFLEQYYCINCKSNFMAGKMCPKCKILLREEIEYNENVRYFTEVPVENLEEGDAVLIPGLQDLVTVVSVDLSKRRNKKIKVAYKNYTVIHYDNENESVRVLDYLRDLKYIR